MLRLMIEDKNAVDPTAAQLASPRNERLDIF